MEDEQTGARGVAVGPCAGVMMDVWPCPELAGPVGQGHGLMGRRLAMA